MAIVQPVPRIRVVVRSFYVPEQSVPHAGRYLFGYHIRICNEGHAPARLLSRHWIITDARGHVEEVRGPGVVGQHPRLEPGECFEYTSACPLETPCGQMRGSYLMACDDGRQFEVPIAPFILATTDLLN